MCSHLLLCQDHHQVVHAPPERTSELLFDLGEDVPGYLRHDGVLDRELGDARVAKLRGVRFSHAAEIEILDLSKEPFYRNGFVCSGS